MRPARVQLCIPTQRGGITMAKKGMARPDWTHTQPRNEVPPVPQIQGKAKHGKERAKPLEGGAGRERKD